MEFQDLKVEVPLDEENGLHLLNVPVKKYQNQDGTNFITGFDVTSKEAEERRLKRARRFGLSAKEKMENITEIEALPSAVQNLPKGNEDAEARADAILLFGVSEMSTKDVFDYFQDYMAGSIEWIDDVSCVVVWDDENSAKRAFVNMGTKFSGSSDSGISEDDEQMGNIWRIGIKHPKSKQLLMRPATKEDKKTKGAGSRSLYYLVHGRPEQQKANKRPKRSLVSSSRRRKINADQSRVKTELNHSPEVEILDADLDENMDALDDGMDVDDDDEPAIKVLITEDMPGEEEPPAGSLYADQERRTNIRSRLSKPSADVIRQRSERFMESLPNSAKMDEGRLQNSIKVNHKGQQPRDNVGDLRQKLKNRKKRFGAQARPSLSIEIKSEDS